MENKMKKSVFILCIAMCIGFLCGCGGGSSISAEEMAKVYGTWVKTNDDMTTTYTINSDGTYTEFVYAGGDFPVSMTTTGTYVYDGETITFTDSDMGIDYSFGVSFEGEDLILDNEGYQSRYTKK